jgi:riboflavin synthase
LQRAAGFGILGGMFTGIVERIGVVRAVSATAAGKRIAVDLAALAEGSARGHSISLSGCCQTVAEISGTVAVFDTVPETLRLTTLGGLRVGDRVNLERSLRVGDRLGGHFVTGHIDGTATLAGRREQGGERLWTFAAEADLLSQMAAKGSVAIDGVSLTLVEVTDRGFSVALIPTTLGDTTLGELQVGQKANIETDVLGKYVLKHLAAGGAPGLTVEKLRAAGFME